MLGVRSNTELWIHCETRHKDHPKPQHMQQHHWRTEPGIFSMLKMCQLKQTLLNEKVLPQNLGGCKRGDVWQNGKVSTVSFCVSFGMRDFPTKLCLVQLYNVMMRMTCTLCILQRQSIQHSKRVRVQIK